MLVDAECRILAKQAMPDLDAIQRGDEPVEFVTGRGKRQLLSWFAIRWGSLIPTLWTVGGSDPGVVGTESSTLRAIELLHGYISAAFKRIKR